MSETVDVVVVTQRLAEAEAALHALLTGSKAEELRVSSGLISRSVRYSAANIGELRAYIGDLRRQLGLVPTRRRAIGLRF